MSSNQDKELLIALKESDIDWITQLVALRINKGIDQLELARRIGVDVQEVEKFEGVTEIGHSPGLSVHPLLYARAIGAYTAHIVVDAEGDAREDIQKMVDKNVFELKKRIGSR